VSIFDKLSQIRGVTWAWNDASSAVGKTPGSADAGVIAQEVEAVFPELVATLADGFKRVNYTGLVGVVIEAVKELKAKNEALEKRVADLEKLLREKK
jgi:Chaperone of endosialidase